LHIKPASKTVCFQVGRGRARQEVVRLLRDWHRFGVRDVVYDRKSNVVNARVDKANRKSSCLLPRTVNTIFLPTPSHPIPSTPLPPDILRRAGFAAVLVNGMVFL
jgi:Fungal kinase associated-1 domain